MVYPLSNSQQEMLQHYIEMLQKWNSSINLVGDSHTLLDRHIADCLQLLDHLPASQHFTLIDMGSGAGLPGLILAMAGTKNIDLVESDRRKSIFLKEVIKKLHLDTAVHTKRVEDIEKQYDVITARAFAPLAKLLTYSFPLMKDTSVCLFPKGKNYSNEIKEAQRQWDFHYERIPSHTDPASTILRVSHLRKKAHD